MTSRRSSIEVPAIVPGETAPATAAVGCAANLPMPLPQLVHRLCFDEFAILAVKDAGGGVMGAKRITLQFNAEPRVIETKWKATRASGDSWNNSPHREIGTYAVQWLFLDADQYIVPPTVVRSIPLPAYRPIAADPAPTFPGTGCVLGVLASWLENVMQPDNVLDRERFEKDAAYAVRFANLNLLHYLVLHRDARANNFLISIDPADPRVFSIDNGIAFGRTLYNFFSAHFNKIRVPLPRASIDRLRLVSRQDLDRLGVLGQLETDAAGVLHNVQPGTNIDPDNAMRVAPWGVQFGLARAEIDALADRLQQLLAKVDAGEQAVF